MITIIFVHISYCIHSKPFSTISLLPLFFRVQEHIPNPAVLSAWYLVPYTSTFGIIRVLGLLVRNHVKTVMHTFAVGAHSGLPPTQRLAACQAKLLAPHHPGDLGKGG